MKNTKIQSLSYSTKPGAHGLSLQLANRIIYFSLPLSSELFEQSKKRVHRIGQARPCFYYYLLVENSVDGKIFKTLEERKDYTDYLFTHED
jgi:SNF2 family DNA or RNA helicase